MKTLKYTHCSASKYVCEREYKIEDLKKEMSMDLIKLKFTPVNFKWEDLKEKEISKKK